MKVERKEGSPVPSTPSLILTKFFEAPTLVKVFRTGDKKCES